MATHAVRHDPTESPLRLHRMDLDTYHRLVESGALDGLDVELLDGLLIDRDSRCEEELPIHRLDVGTYERMVASGALEGQHIELLEGLPVAVSPQGPRHAAVIRRLTHHLSGTRGSLGVQLPFEAGWGELPEPDLVLTKDEPPADRHPRTALLVVEVAVSSHELDRGTKATMYALAPVRAYWLVDVPGRAVEVRDDPGPKGYRRCTTYRVGDAVPSPVEGVADLDVTWLFNTAV